MSAGRPPKDEAERLSSTVRVRVTTEQRALIESAAAMEGAELSEWARPILVRAARARVGSSAAAKRALNRRPDRK